MTRTLAAQIHCCGERFSEPIRDVLLTILMNNECEVIDKARETHTAPHTRARTHALPSSSLYHLPPRTPTLPQLNQPTAVFGHLVVHPETFDAVVGPARTSRARLFRLLATCLP
jgi:hypothetical protein